MFFSIPLLRLYLIHIFKECIIFVFSKIFTFLRIYDISYGSVIMGLFNPLWLSIWVKWSEPPLILNLYRALNVFKWFIYTGQNLTLKAWCDLNWGKQSLVGPWTQTRNLNFSDGKGGKRCGHLPYQLDRSHQPWRSVIWQSPHKYLGLTERKYTECGGVMSWTMSPKCI